MSIRNSALMLAAGALLFLLCRSHINHTSSLKWGNTFTFQSDEKFDSVHVSLGGITTGLDFYYSKKPPFQYGNNARTPEDDFPCEVNFLLFQDGKIKRMNAPDFDCNHCDLASHDYTLFNDSIIYSFTH